MYIVAISLPSLDGMTVWWVLLSRLAVTKLDILDVFDEVKVGVSYKLAGQVLSTFPGKIGGVSVTVSLLL